jgi:hypothetical protein
VEGPKWHNTYHGGGWRITFAYQTESQLKNHLSLINLRRLRLRKVRRLQELRGKWRAKAWRWLKGSRRGWSYLPTPLDR